MQYDVGENIPDIKGTTDLFSPFTLKGITLLEMSRLLKAKGPSILGRLKRVGGVKHCVQFFLLHTLLTSVSSSDLSGLYPLWQYGFGSFQTGYTKLERFLHKKQHTQRKLLNFEKWTNGEPQYF